MNDYIEKRAVLLGEYIVQKRTTVRDAAKIFGISKSTVHKDITVRLRQVSPSLYKEIRQLLDLNKQERHIRGGMATRRKYALEKERKNASEKSV